MRIYKGHYSGPPFNADAIAGFVILAFAIGLPMFCCILAF